MPLQDHIISKLNR